MSARSKAALIRSRRRRGPAHRRYFDTGKPSSQYTVAEASQPNAPVSAGLIFWIGRPWFPRRTNSAGSVHQSHRDDDGDQGDGAAPYEQHQRLSHIRVLANPSVALILLHFLAAHPVGFPGSP
jgi:hypothetical protein